MLGVELTRYRVRKGHTELEIKEELLVAAPREDRSTLALRPETRREARVDSAHCLFERVALWRRKSRPQQTHTLIESPPRRA